MSLRAHWANVQILCIPISNNVYTHSWTGFIHLCAGSVRDGVLPENRQDCNQKS